RDNSMIYVSTLILIALFEIFSVMIYAILGLIDFNLFHFLFYRMLPTLFLNAILLLLIRLVMKVYKNKRHPIDMK
ncbi:rod shape-determining protein MreD, partial [Staphylococcus felis]